MIVIISSGISNNPIKPNTNEAAIKFGIIPISESLKDLNKTTFLMVDFSHDIKNSDNEIRYFLKTKMYNNKKVLKKNNSGKSIVKKLFAKFKISTK